MQKYASEKSASSDGTWRHVKVTLKPINPAFRPIELTTDDEGTVQVVAELVACWDSRLHSWTARLKCCTGFAAPASALLRLQAIHCGLPLKGV